MRTARIGKLNLQLSFDDFHPGNDRLAELLKDRGIYATFFIETNPPGALEQARRISEMGHDVGCHTRNHPQDMKMLDPYALGIEVGVARRELEATVGRSVNAFCYPRGRHDERVREAVRSAGFREARTTRVLELNAPGEDPLQMGTAAHMLDGRKEYDGSKWDDVAMHFAAQAADNGMDCHVWGHMFELERNREDGVKRLLNFIEWCRHTFVTE